MELIRGTTPTIDCNIPSNIDLKEATEIWFTIKQYGKIVVDRALSKNEIIVDDQKMSVTLTQEETLKLKTYEHAECGIRIYLGSEKTAWAMDHPEPVIVLDVVKPGIIGEEVVE